MDSDGRNVECRGLSSNHSKFLTAILSKESPKTKRNFQITPRLSKEIRNENSEHFLLPHANSKRTFMHSWWFIQSHWNLSLKLKSSSKHLIPIMYTSKMLFLASVQNHEGLWPGKSLHIFIFSCSVTPGSLHDSCARLLIRSEWKSQKNFSKTSQLVGKTSRKRFHQKQREEMRGKILRCGHKLLDKDEDDDSFRD
jgi:hypothetical protein